MKLMLHGGFRCYSCPSLLVMPLGLSRHLIRHLSHADIEVLSPFIGGMLSRPQDRWPRHFSHPFWVEYPYFLPCFAVAVCGCASLAANAIYLKEVCLLFVFNSMTHE